MSSSRVFRRNETPSVRRWVPGDFAEAASPAVAAPPPPPPPEPAAPKAEPAPVPAVVEAAVPPPPPEPQAPPLPDPAELEAVRQQARREGYEAGHAAGLQAALPDLERFRAVLTHLETLAEDLEQGIANDVMSLALELTKQILRQSLRVKPELVLAVIRDATRSFPELGASPRLILHPDDAAIVRTVVASSEDPELGQWVLVEDERIERGGCKFQNSTTEIDATLENRWRRIVATLGRDDAWLDLNL